MDTSICQVGGSFADEESLLVAARDAAFEAARQRPTRLNLKAYRLACVELKEFLRAKSDTELSFTTLADVLAHLQANGWKISESTIYEHRARGKIRATIQGRYTFTAVNKYARSHLRKLDGTRVK